jgi:hypothetical protein
MVILFACLHDRLAASALANVAHACLADSGCEAATAQLKYPSALSKRRILYGAFCAARAGLNSRSTV